MVDEHQICKPECDRHYCDQRKDAMECNFTPTYPRQWYVTVLYPKYNAK